jgi:hypothetical protein
MQLNGLQKTTALRLIEGVEIQQDTSKFSVNFLTVVPFFKVCMLSNQHHSMGELPDRWLAGDTAPAKRLSVGWHFSSCMASGNVEFTRLVPRNKAGGAV